MFGVRQQADRQPDTDAAITALMAVRSQYSTLTAHLVEHKPGDITQIGMFSRLHRHTLPCWSTLAFQSALLQPASACIDRVFSMLQNQLDNSQTRALEDYRV